MIRPPFLHAGSKIALIAPSGAVDAIWIDGAIQTLEKWGLEVIIGQHARGKYHRFAGTDTERLADLQWAIDQPDIAALLCLRGGYGLTRLIDKVNLAPLVRTPKWLLGFSDITVLHGALSAIGIESIHSIMAKQISMEQDPSQQLRRVLFGEMPRYEVAPHNLNKIGTATGKLIGGNLSVLYGLRSTPYDIQPAGNILLIEDLCEPLYHIDRMMQNLRLSGVLAQISGLIVGQFSDMAPDTSFAQGAYGIIAEAVKDYHYPVCMNAPIGHVDQNYPLIIGATTQLTVQSNTSTIQQL